MGTSGRPHTLTLLKEASLKEPLKWIQLWTLFLKGLRFFEGIQCIDFTYDY